MFVFFNLNYHFLTYCFSHQLFIKLSDTKTNLALILGTYSKLLLVYTNTDQMSNMNIMCTRSVPRRESEQIIHGVGVVAETVGLLQQLKGGHAESLWKARVQSVTVRHVTINRSQDETDTGQVRICTGAQGQ